MVAGRPRTTSFSVEEMIELGEEMVEWVIKNKKTLHLSEWYTIEKGFLYREWKTFIQREEFIPHYEKALKIIGKKYLDGTIHPSIANRWQRNYFTDLKEREDIDAKEKSALRTKEIKEGLTLDQIKERYYNEDNKDSSYRSNNSTC